MAEEAAAQSDAKRLNMFGQPLLVRQMQSEGGAAGALHGSVAEGGVYNILIFYLLVCSTCNHFYWLSRTAAHAAKHVQAGRRVNAMCNPHCSQDNRYSCTWHCYSTSLIVSGPQYFRGSLRYLCNQVLWLCFPLLF